MSGVTGTCRTRVYSHGRSSLLGRIAPDLEVHLTVSNLIVGQTLIILGHMAIVTVLIGARHMAHVAIQLALVDLVRLHAGLFQSGLLVALQAVDTAVAVVAMRELRAIAVQLVYSVAHGAGHRCFLPVDTALNAFVRSLILADHASAVTPAAGIALRGEVNHLVALEQAAILSGWPADMALAAGSVARIAVVGVRVLHLRAAQISPSLR